MRHDFSNRYRPVLLTLLLALLAAASAHAQTVLLWDGDRPTGPTLAVGTKLYVGLDGYTFGVDYAARLLDEMGAPIAEATLDWDPTGGLLPTFLWQDVVPCEHSPNPARLQFARYEEAESGLDGRQLSLVLTGDGQVITVIPITFDVDLAVPRLYAAGPDGRPCAGFGPIAPVYVAGYHVEHLPRDLRVFFVRDQNTWSDGQPLYEMRPAYAGAPQVIALDPGQDSFHELAWHDVPSELCPFDTIVQPGPETTPTFDAGDIVFEQPEIYCGGTGRGVNDPECMPCPPSDGP